MRITHVFWSLGFGGIETMLVNIANAQAEAEAQVSVVIINDSCEESLMKSLRSDVKLYVLGRKVGSKGLGFILKLNKVLGELKPDVVQRIDYIASHYEEAMVKATEAHCYVRNIYDVSVTAHSYLREYERLKS